MIDFIGEHIVDVWAICVLLMLPMALIGNRRISRWPTIAIFVFYGFLASLKGESFNQDIMNYVAHFNGALSTDNWIGFVFGGWFEPGYSFLVYLISRFANADLFIFIITVLPFMIFAQQFIRYRYHPAIILFVFSTITLVSSVAIVKHHFAMAFVFIILNCYYFKKKLNILAIVASPLFHFSSIPIVAASVIANKSRAVNASVAVVAILLAIFAYHDVVTFLSTLIDHAIDRIEGPSGTAGMRNIMLMMLVLVVFYSHRMRAGQQDSMLGIALATSALLMFFPGLNRVLSFFMLAVLTYIHRNDASHPAFAMGKSILTMNIMSIASAVFFATTYVAH